MSPLSGRTVVTTREHDGVLNARLRELGAEVIHMPLIATADVPVGAVPDHADWLVVTSANGARRAGPFLTSDQTRTAAVGEATAAALLAATGRPADLIPERSTAQDLVAVLPSAPERGGRMIVLRGDRARDDVVDGARAAGWEVIDVVVYQTVAVEPDRTEVLRASSADAVLLASGSAAESWATALTAVGVESPTVIAIGEPTATAATRVGLRVDAVADPPGVGGLIEATIASLSKLS